MYRLSKLLFTMLILFALSLSARAVTTQFIADDDIADFEAGKFDNVTLNINGHLSFSPMQKELFSKEDILYVWSSAKDSRGNIYFATGNKPHIYKSSKGKKAKLLYKHKSGLSVSSLSIDSKNNIYASIMPGGTIIKIKPNGSSKVFAKLKDKYIWKIIHDKKDNLYAVTGATASLYKITKDAIVKKLFSSVNEANLLSLAIDNKNNLIFGSGGKGILYKLNPSKKDIKVLYNTYENEIKDIVIDKKDNIYFATATTTRKYPPNTFDYRDSFVLYGSYEKRQSKAKGSKKLPLKNSIYKIGPSGKLEKLLTLNETLFLALAIDENSNLYSGTSDKGIIYKIEGVNKASIFVSTEELYILSLLIDKDNLIATTGNIGKVLNISLAYKQNGKYTSRVFDTNGITKWGLIKWDSIYYGKQSTLSFHTRVGNTKIPDSTWSKWSRAYRNKKGSYITSPSAKYIQYKLVLNNKTRIAPIIKAVRISYLPANHSPNVENIRLKKESNQEASISYNINDIIPNTLSLTWEGTDQDRDFLTYTVYFKEENYRSWILLEKDLNNNILSFDSRKLPDGNYYFKVRASDRKSNTKERALVGENISQLLKIDNSPPLISSIKITKKKSYYFINGLITDKLSLIKSIHYSLNSREWVYINPSDLIYDSIRETFSLKIKINDAKLLQDKNIVIFRAADEFDNFSLYSTSFINKNNKAVPIIRR